MTITTGGTGSGTGITDAATGTVNMGASDAYLSSANLQQYPGLLNIALAISAQQINYNVPGVKNLNLNGTVLAQIYAGKITNWNDPAIKKLNPGVSLPNLKIIPLHRAESSGDTFLFTSYMNAQDPSGWSAANVNTTVNWPSVLRCPGRDRQQRHGGRLPGQQGLHRLHRDQLPAEDPGRRPRHGVTGQQGRQVPAADLGGDQCRGGGADREDPGQRVALDDQRPGG